MSGDAALDVVIVAYRSRELLRECLGSLRAHPPAGPMKVVVVDNASGDGTPEMVASEFPEVDLIASARNLGFAAATNLGARRGNAPYLLALNPDTAVTAGALDTVIAVARARMPRSGWSVLVSSGRTASLDHAARRSFPTPLSALGHFSGLGRRRRGLWDRLPPIARQRSNPARWTQSTAPSCSCAARCSRRPAASTRTTGCTWRTWTSPTGLPRRVGGAGTSPRRP